MEKKEKKTHRYGLVGRDISYSFSRGYFTEKFKNLNLPNHAYVNFDLQEIKELPKAIEKDYILHGLNVTIPYKQQVIDYVDELDEEAKKIGAVNTIKFTKNGLIGYNTDAYGFEKSIEPSLQKHHKKALILGTGGASKAVAYVFETLNIDFKFVSRNPNKEQLSYRDINEKLLLEYTIIVNCTPLGTHPDILSKPDIPYAYLSEEHLLFDLIYNPAKTSFLRLGEEKNATICNGKKMLEYQAEKSWEIWNS